MADGNAPVTPVGPREVADLATRLHDTGIVNLDKPVRAYIDHLKTIAPDSSLIGSYAVAWSGYVVVVKEK